MAAVIIVANAVAGASTVNSTRYAAAAADSLFWWIHYAIFRLDLSEDASQ